MIRCPNCNQSHFTILYTSRTAMYYPPIYKDGINENPDENVTTTYAHCLDCHYDFLIKEQGECVWTEKQTYNPSKQSIGVNITAQASSIYTPIENQMSNSVATINTETGQLMREKNNIEIILDKLVQQVQRLQNDVDYLKGLYEH